MTQPLRPSDLKTSRRQFLGASAAMTAAIAGYAGPGAQAQAGGAPPPTSLPVWRDLFNGKDLTGWINVNTAPDTWSVKNGLLICTGKPTGVMRTDRMYENFIIYVEWMHLEAGGNSGMFLWSSAAPRGNLPNGIEIQMLELDYVNQGREGSPPRDIAYVHGETWGVGDVKAVPDNPRGIRSKSLENRALGRGHWNTYIVVAVDGVIKMSVNGKVVNGLSQSSQRKGYICMESEGAEIHFRNLKIMELPVGMATPEQTARELT